MNEVLVRVKGEVFSIVRVEEFCHRLGPTVIFFPNQGMASFFEREKACLYLN